MVKYSEIQQRQDVLMRSDSWIEELPAQEVLSRFQRLLGAGYLQPRFENQGSTR